MYRILTSVAVVCLALVLPLISGAADKKPWKDSQIQVGDIKIHYIEAGAGERALVFIPGWTMTAEIWKEQILYFSSRGFHVFALDPRSQGQTTKTEVGNTYLQQAADLHAFLKALKIEHASLVGWSSSVAVLLEYLSSPETLQPEKLVLVDGSPCGLKDADCPSGATIQQVRTMLLAIEDDRSKMTTQFVRSMFRSHPQELLVKEIGDACLKTPTGAALSLFIDGITGDRRPALARVGVPTLVVVPDERRLLGEDMQSKITRAKLEVIPEAGHALFLEKPQTFNQILESFLGDN
jgi:microsomal epoxide hydrolase